LSTSCRLIHGSVSDVEAVTAALDGQHVVVHLAAETGTGQSMYEVRRYSDTNLHGTSTLMDVLVNSPSRTVRKLVVASSRAIYGEGKYRCHSHGVVYPESRTLNDLQAGSFEPRCPECREKVSFLPTDETAPFRPTSFYGLTKQAQEQTALLFAQSLGISGFALRYQNVYGPGQSLKNPYTGILAIFSNLARENQPIQIFEDGEESRDFVFIEDVIEATWRCIRPETEGIDSFNVGSGIPTTVLEAAGMIRSFFSSESKIHISGAFRIGDIRHNVADLTKISSALRYEPKWPFRDGVAKFLAWASAENPESGLYAGSLEEMRLKGLFQDGRFTG
jgi:dTDP-L-rhamnose 4-epimerase